MKSQVNETQSITSDHDVRLATLRLPHITNTLLATKKLIYYKSSNNVKRIKHADQKIQPFEH